MIPNAHMRPPPPKSAKMFSGKLGVSGVPGSICGGYKSKIMDEGV